MEIPTVFLSESILKVLMIFVGSLVASKQGVFGAVYTTISFGK
jgi:hypothetical protein